MTIVFSMHYPNDAYSITVGFQDKEAPFGMYYRRAIDRAPELLVSNMEDMFRAHVLLVDYITRGGLARAETGARLMHKFITAIRALTSKEGENYD